MDEKADAHSARWLAGSLLAFTAIYCWFFVLPYLSEVIVMGGDTQVLWSFNYLAMLSLKTYGEFLWWDPTTLNGWPAYVNLTSGWFNYMSPYALPSIILFKIASLFGDVSINTFLVLQKTLYYFTLNLLAVLLISREVISSRIARVLPALIFTLSAIQFHGFRDSVLYESMPAGLFFIWTLVHHVNRNTARSFVLLMLFSALYIASLNYGALQTSFWWIGTFVIFLFLLQRDWISSLYEHPRRMWQARGDRHTLLLVSALIATAATAFLLPVVFNLGELLRVPGSGPVDYFTGASGGFGAGQNASPAHNPAAGNLSYPIWSSLFYWIPFESIHDAFLPFDVKEGGVKAGVDHRYIGLVTIPMLLAAVTIGAKDRWGLAFVMAAFACAAFVTYTDRNLLVIRITELSNVLRNIRTIADTLPRDGPVVFLAIAAGIGFDKLVCARSSDDIEEASLSRLLIFLLGGGCALAVAAIAVSISPPAPTTALAVPVSPARMSEAFAHIGIYLLIFCVSALLLVLIRHQPTRIAIAAAVLVFSFMDLTISATGYWQRGMVWFRNEGPHTLPKADHIPPIRSAIQNWPGSYAGFIHNPFGGPFIGLRSWLVLSSRPAWQSVLENYNPQLRLMKKYPDYRFFENTNYLPFATIADIDAVAAPPATNWFVVHDPAAPAVDTAAPRPIDARWEILHFSPNRVRLKVEMPKDGYMMALDNYNRFWSARVDSGKARIVRANYTFKAIRVPQGTHIVEWTYNPYPVWIAWSLFYVLLLILLCHIAGLALLPSTLGAVAVVGLVYAATVFVIRDAPAARSLSGGELVCSADGPVLRVPGGPSYKVEKGMAGSVEGIFPEEGGGTKIIGWAIDESVVEPARVIVATVGGLVWFEAAPHGLRPDVAGFNRGYANSGYAASGKGATDSDRDRIRVFAVLRNGTARELQYAKKNTRTRPPALNCER